MGLQLVLYVSSQRAVVDLFKYSKHTQTPATVFGPPVHLSSAVLSGLWYTCKYVMIEGLCEKRTTKGDHQAPVETLTALKALTV